MFPLTALLVKTARLAFALALLALISLPAAHAGTVYATGFETTDTPSYTVGALAGQNGWLEFNSASSIVTNVIAYAGSQSVFVNGNNSNLQAGPYYPNSPAGPLIELSAEIIIFSGTEGDWQFAATGPGLSQYLGGIDLVPQGGAQSTGGTIDNIFLISGAFPNIGTFNLNTWNLVDLVFNMTSQTYSFSLNGTTLASGAPFCGSNGACTGANVLTYGDSFFDVFQNTGNTDSGFMDNFSLSSNVPGVPEPGSLLLFGSGLALLIRRKLARR